MRLCEEADSSVCGSHVSFCLSCVCVRAVRGSVLIRVLCVCVCVGVIIKQGLAQLSS